MKKLFLAGVLFGALNLAQATTINAPSGMVGSNVLVGTYAYLWSVPLNQAVTGASITFSSVTETASGNGNDISVDVGSFIGMTVGQSSAPASGNYSILTDNDAKGDAFAANTTGLKPTAINLGTEPFPTLNVAETWAYTFSAAQLLALNTYISAGNWGFEIDPDCHFNVGGITFTYTTGVTNKTSVPDHSTTAVLLGLTLLGLLAVRRKFCLN
jgi:hypothetical protein